MDRKSFTVGGLNIALSVIAFLAQILVARNLGIGKYSDIFYASLSVPTFISGLIVAALSYSETPKIAITSSDELDTQIKILNLYLYSAILSTALLLLGVGVLDYQIGTFLPNTHLSSSREIQTLFLLGWFLSAIQVIASVGNITMTGLGKPVTTIFLNSLPYFGIIVASFLFYSESVRPENIYYGFIFGTFLSLVLGVFLNSQYLKLGGWSFNWSYIRENINSTKYDLFAMLAFTSYPVVDTYWGSVSGEGVVTTLAYAQRLVIGVGGILVAVPALVYVPKFASMINASPGAEIKKFAIKMIWITLGLSVCAMLPLLIFSDYIVNSLYVRGNFDIYAGENVASALRYNSLGMVCMTLSVVVLRMLYCFKSVSKISASLGLFWFITYFALSGSMHQFGANGISAAYTISWFLYLILILTLLKRMADDVRSHS